MISSDMENTEPLLTPNDKRFVMFPIQYEDIWEMYQKQVNSFWRPEDIDLSSDMKDWNTLNENEQYFISMILAFFAASDGIVGENLGTRFMSEVQVSEARAFYAMQIFMETVHSHTYSILIDTYIQDAVLKDKYFNAIQHFPCIKKKADWSIQWIQNKSSFATRLVAFACVEGIFFSGAFCAIYWIKERGLMKGLTVSNEYISRDEGLHTEFAVLLYNKLNSKLKKNKIQKIIQEAVSIEIEFIVNALPCKLIGMNSDLMSQYIKYVADRLSLQLGYEKIYEVENPFPWMQLISIQGKTNFFEKRVTDYAMANKKNDGDVFDFTENF